MRASSSSRWSRQSATTLSYMGLSTGDQPVVFAETAKTLRAILDDWKQVRDYYEKANPSAPSEP